MFKSLVGRISRWIRRKSDRYCTIELDKDARGLAKCLSPGPPTKKEKEERCRKQLLRGVNENDHDKIIEHFYNLRKEVDPLENEKEISINSIKVNKVDMLTKIDRSSKTHGHNFRRP